jgi:hypothetical protein
VMQAWLSSAGHRANIERAGFRAIGVGVAANASGRLEWTQDFGSQLDASSRAPAPPPPPSPAPPPPAAAPPPTSPAPQPEPAGRTSSILSPALPVLSESVFAPGPAAPARVPAPRVLITRAPAALSTSAAAGFSWVARGAVTTTTCVLDGRRPRRCRPAVRYAGLARGRRHTFVVRVTGPGGTATARHSWRIRGLHRLQQ